MSAQSTQVVTDALRVRGRNLWQGVLPEALGLVFVASLFGGLVLTYLVGDYAWQQQTQKLRAAEARTVAEALAGVVAHSARAQDELQTQALLKQVAQATPDLQTLQWQRPNGSLAFAWPAQVAPDVAAQTETITAPVTAEDGTPLGALELTRTLRAAPSERLFLLWVSGGAACMALVAFVISYRHLKRRLRPAAAIDRNLRRVADGVEHELATLRLSDSLGSAAQGWNQLVEQLAELSQKVKGDAADAGSADVLARFESGNFRRVVDRLPYGVLYVGEEQTITYANKSAGALLGRKVEELRDMQIGEAVENPSVTQAVLSAQTRHAAGGTSVDHTQGDAGHEVTLRFRIVPLTDRSSGAALITIEDVSQLRAGERARDNFLYHVTHELRTPLTNIHAYTETLTQPGFDDEQTRKECYNVIVSETKRLSTLVENILNVSQLEVGTARLDIGDVDLARLIRQMVQDNLGHADEKQIDLTLALPPKMPKVRGDKQRLSVLLNNLIGNAVKYTPEGGKVEVRVELVEQQIRIAVADTGIGIAAEDQQHVFDKFYRAADSAVQEETGTGLGLSLAREVARLHGGEIHLESEPGQGSTFTIELPAPVDASAESGAQ